MELKYQITSVAISDKYIFYGGVDNSIKAWNLVSGNFLEFALLGHKDTITGIRISKSNSLVSNSMDKSLRKWDVKPFVLGGVRLQ